MGDSDGNKVADDLMEPGRAGDAVTDSLPVGWTRLSWMQAIEISCYLGRCSG